MSDDLTADQLARIKALVGDVSREQLRLVDCFVGEEMALFLPTVGPCFYAATPDHSHPGYSFVLCFDSYTRLVVEERELPVEPGLVMAMDPGAVHHEVVSDHPPHYIAIFISSRRFEADLARYPVLKRLPFAFRSFAPGRELIGLLKEFMNECHAQLPGAPAVLDAIATRISHSLIRSAFDISVPSELIGSRVEIHRAIQHMQTHAGEKLTLDLLAEIAAMSPSHFSRVFRHETGETPLAYLNRVRLEQARKLLRAGEGSIGRVALSCGFATPSHFSEAYRRAYGQTPTAFLKSLTKV